jgi:hypothetical protein
MPFVCTCMYTCTTLLKGMKHVHKCERSPCIHVCLLRKPPSTHTPTRPCIHPYTHMYAYTCAALETYDIPTEGYTAGSDAVDFSSASYYNNTLGPTTGPALDLQVHIYTYTYMHACMCVYAFIHTTQAHIFMIQSSTPRPNLRQQCGHMHSYQRLCVPVPRMHSCIEHIYGNSVGTCTVISAYACRFFVCIHA